jgi:hypothetical protein
MVLPFLKSLKITQELRNLKISQLHIYISRGEEPVRQYLTKSLGFMLALSLLIPNPSCFSDTCPAPMMIRAREYYVHPNNVNVPFNSDLEGEDENSSFGFCKSTCCLLAAAVGGFASAWLVQRKGSQGSGGDEGVQGLPGPQGPQGILGILGPQGPEGPDGPPGFQGATGPDGPEGTFPVDTGESLTFTITLALTAVLPGDSTITPFITLPDQSVLTGPSFNISLLGSQTTVFVVDPAIFGTYEIGLHIVVDGIAVSTFTAFAEVDSSRDETTTIVIAPVGTVIINTNDAQYQLAEQFTYGTVIP